MCVCMHRKASVFLSADERSDGSILLWTVLLREPISRQDGPVVTGF